MPKTTRCFPVLLLSTVAVCGMMGCSSTEKSTVAVEYTLNPSRGLPPGMTTVAVLDAEVNEVTDRKWSELAANYIQDLIQDANEEHGTQLRVADRKNTAAVMKEADLAAAGLVASDRAGQIAQVLDVQGFIMCEINVKVDKQVGTERTISDINIFSRSGGVSTREVEKESRHITVQTDFKLMDARTSENWLTHSPPAFHRTDETSVSPIFGSGGTEASMTSRDEIIGAAVETGARQFVSQIMPITVRHEFKVKSSDNENCQEGVAYLRGDMPERALEHFEAALEQDPADDRAAFGAGVACATLGRYQEALDYFRNAAVLENEEKYIRAKELLAADISRIRR